MLRALPHFQNQDLKKILLLYIAEMLSFEGAPNFMFYGAIEYKPMATITEST